MGATKGDGSLHDLTSRQTAVAVALIAGGTHEDAARAAGVHRVTVTRWVNHHPAFIAEMNRLRTDTTNRMQAKIAQVTESALEVVQTAVAAGDLQTAQWWLRLVPPSLVSAVGPTESVDVVESVRAGMRSPLLAEAMPAGLEQTTEEAERMISERLSA